MERVKEMSLEEIAKRYCTMGGFTSCNKDNLYRSAQQYWRDSQLDEAIAAYEKKLMKQYPQGWQSYPGDVCKHGVYVGGDYDCACARCELGDD